MISPLDPTELRYGTTAEVVARHIRADIEAGKLRDGQQLPSSRELSKEWGVSVATITRAMNKLAAEGLIINRARSSRVVNYPAPPSEAPQPTAPKVILIGGYAGSGKTELGRILARRTHWPLLDKDSATRAVVEAALETLGQSPHDRESYTYLTVVRPAEYEALLTITCENLECGNSAIVTAPFIRELADPAWCERTTARITALGGELHVIWVRCDADSMRTYLRHRGAARDAAKLANWPGYLSGVDLEYAPAIDHTIIDNSAHARPLQQQAEDFLAKVTA